MIMECGSSRALLAGQLGPGTAVAHLNAARLRPQQCRSKLHIGLKQPASIVCHSQSTADDSTPSFHAVAAEVVRSCLSYMWQHLHPTAFIIYT